jgi:molecular chaperone GrpE
MKKQTTKNTTTDIVDQQVKALQEQIANLDANWKRSLADYQNLLRRVESDKKEFLKMSNANLIARLLPSLDIIELAASHTGDMGVQLAAKQFREALKQEGLEEITPSIGDLFDHSLHECGETVSPLGDHVQNSIAELILKGYRLGDYVLRAAKVKVYKAVEPII